jgi:chromosome partitioning protein
VQFACIILELDGNQSFIGLEDCMASPSKVRSVPAKGAKAREASATTAPQRRKPSKAKWLTASSGKGGSGKSSTILNLAVFAAHEGLRVCVVDLDSQQSLRIWHEARPAEAPDISLWHGKLRDVQQAIDDIDGRAEFDLVLVDTPPGLDDYPKPVLTLVKKSDFVLVPTSQFILEIQSVTKWMEVLKREHCKAAFLVNRTKRGQRSYRLAMNLLIKSGPVCPIDVRDLSDIATTPRLGVGVLEVTGSPAIADYEGVWHFVRSELGMG